MKPPGRRPPWRIALLAFAITIVVGAVIGAIVMEARPSRGMTPFERGEALGNALGMLAIVVAAVTYLIAWRRQQKSSDR
jgi:uncharacterized transporter YbjL